MKIIKQTSDELIIKDGSAKNIIFGIIFALIGGAGAIYLNFVVSTPFWITMVFFIVGIIVILTSSSIVLSINKLGNQVGYQSKRIIGGKSYSYTIDNVLRIETRKSWKIQRNNQSNSTISIPRQVLVWQTIIIFKDGLELPISHEASSSSSIIGSMLMNGSGTEVAIATQIATFMGVPFQEIAPPDGGLGINLGSLPSIKL